MAAAERGRDSLGPLDALDQHVEAVAALVYAAGIDELKANDAIRRRCLAQ